MTQVSEVGIWKCVDGVWGVPKRYKSVDWSEIDWSQEGQTGCPYCIQELGGDTSQDNFTVYGLNDEGMANGGHCWSCNTTIVSVEKALEDKSNKTSFNSKVKFNTLESSAKKEVVYKEEKRLSSKVVNSDEKKLMEKRLTQEQLNHINSTTSDTLRVNYRGLDKDVCKELGVRWRYSTDKGLVTEMWCPAHVIENGEKILTGYHIRIIRDKEGKLCKDFRTEGYVGKLNCFFGQTNSIKETLIIQAGQIDVISSIQMMTEALQKYPTRVPVIVSSMIGEGSTFEVIKSQYEWVSGFKKVVLCLDNDKAGIMATEKCKEVLDISSTAIAKLSLGDANEYLKPNSGKTAIDYAQEVFWNPQPLKEYGILGSSGLLERAIESVSVERIPLPPYLSSLNDDVFRGGIGLQEIVNLISAPSLGKSVFVNEIVLHWIMTSPYKQFIISTEDGAGSYVTKLASRIIGNKILACNTVEERVKLLRDNSVKINKYLQDENGNDRFSILDDLPSSLEQMQEVILQAIKIHGCQVIIIDTLSSVIGSRTNQEQEDFMNFQEVTRRNYDVTFINVTHTKKSQEGKALSQGGEATEEMIKGSGAIAQTATVNMILRRDKMSEDSIEKNTTYVDITKNRTVGETGRGLAKVYYSNTLHTLFDFKYAEQHNFFEGVTPSEFRMLQDESKSSFVSEDKEVYNTKAEEEVYDADLEDEDIPF